jgi:hypothetical protein
LFVALLLAAVALTGCTAVGATPVPDDSGSGSGSGSAPATSPGVAPIGGDDLPGALLTTKDLPAGFVPTGSATNATGSVGIGGGGFPGCPPLNSPLTTQQTFAAAATFAKGVLGPYLTHAVLRYPAGGATAVLTRLAEAQRSCTEFSQPMAGFTVRFRLQAGSVPPLGDQTVGLHMVGVADGFNIAVVADVAAIRRGDIVIWLSDLSMGTSARSMVDDLARLAVAKCAQTLPDCATPH